MSCSRCCPGVFVPPPPPPAHTSLEHIAAGKLDYFITASDTHNGIGIENPTPSHRPLHDYTDQQRLFTYLNYRIDDTSRLSFFVNGYNGDFHIPNVPNGTPAFTLDSITSANSAKTDETQNEQEYYTVVAYQKTLDQLSFQISGFSRYGQITFKPDVINDLIFQGVAAGVYNSYLTNGVQNPCSAAAGTGGRNVDQGTGQLRLRPGPGWPAR